MQKRLFLGIPLSQQLTNFLLDCQPEATDKLRLTEPQLFHLTLHFLGNAEPDRIDSAIADFRYGSFRLNLSHTGEFQLRGGGILWVGIQPATALTELHQHLEKRLLQTGYQPETRPYTPHITLARYKKGVAEVVRQAFLSTSVPDKEFIVDEFCLYQSILRPGKSVYQILAKYPSLG